MTTLICQIKELIEKNLDKGFQKFIIFPYGDVGIQIKQILNNVYAVQEAYILDNHLNAYNPRIHPLSLLNKIDCAQYCLLLSSTNPEIYKDLKQAALRYLPVENIAELSSMVHWQGVLAETELTEKEYGTPEYITQIGKYSYGPLCRNHPFIASIGAFCSFAVGTDVVTNHEMRYLTTHPMIYNGAHMPQFTNYESYSKSENPPVWYLDGVCPRREKIKAARRIRIGNDVWLGRNVIVTNYVNIGNGVIAGAGAVITKDVPDYAVVAGVPARILRYRYSPEEIKALNEIAWWDWPDEDIRARYDDFYLPVEDFIRKYI